MRSKGVLSARLFNLIYG
ncbi:TPA: protein YchT [Escherichia coli]|nr:protein YchT [Escherichia coli]MDF8525811.1 protein YchT [Escherichia coli]